MGLVLKGAARTRYQEVLWAQGCPLMEVEEVSSSDKREVQKKASKGMKEKVQIWEGGCKRRVRNFC